MQELMDNAMSPTQAALALGCSPQTVRRLVESGELAGTMTPLGRLVDRRAVAALVAERQAAQQSAATRSR
jgi:excisionase family DNA binding protein